VSLRWGNELLVRLGALHCEAQLIARAGLAHKTVAACTVEGTGPSMVSAALGRLVALGHVLPRQARLLLEEDLLYLCVVDADADGAQTDAQARNVAAGRLSQSLGKSIGELQVEVTLLDGGRAWLASAADIAVLDPALDALQPFAVEARRVGVAALEDLRLVRSLIPREANTLALLRERGLSLLGFERGRLVSIEWEHLDWRHRETLFERLSAYAGPPMSWPSGSQPGGGSAPAAAHGRTRFLQAQTPRQESTLGGAARDTGWVMLPPRLAGTAHAGEAG
jgi:hypothetical protein